MRTTLCVLLAFTLLLAACSGPSDDTGEKTIAEDMTQTTRSGACAAKDCFIAAANDCKDATITATETTGTFTYTTTGCVFTKTLDRAQPDEHPGVKKLLEGKSYSCTYTKDAFDARLVTSLVAGAERCTGPLRDALVDLALFA